MPFIDMTDDSPAWGAKEPGDYAAEVVGAEEKQSKKGEALFVLSFRDINTGHDLCEDVLMLQGKGKGMGLAKLRGLGLTEDFKGDVAAAELIGKRVLLHLNWSTFGGRREMKPDIKQGEYCGYSKLDEKKAIQDNEIDPFSDPPPGEKLDDESVPF